MYRTLPTALLIVLLFVAAAPAAVFQYSVEVEGGKRPGAAFLWIPPEAKQVRGVILGGMTLMERPFAQDPVIRRAAASEGLAIVFLTRGLGRADISKVLGALAARSGYAELAHAPLMFVGHSAGGPQAKGKAIKHADRCFGLLQYRGGGPGGGESLPASVPALMMVGQFDEFGGRMRTREGREQWEGSREHMNAYRTAHPEAAACYVVEPGAGHFAWSDRNAKLAALWIAKAAVARIPEAPVDADSPPKLKKIDAASGWLSDLNVAQPDHDPAAYAEYEGNKARTNWHFDKELADAVAAYHQGLTGRKDQFIRWKDGHWVDAGARFFFTGITWVDDGATFKVHPLYAGTYPGQYKGRGPIWARAGEKVGNSGEPITVRGISGPVRSVGGHKLHMHYDALTPAAARRQRATFMAYSAGNDEYRHTEHVGMLPRGFKGLRRGKDQTITFPAPGKLSVGGEGVELKATSDAGLPVNYYVAYGPAKVADGKLLPAEVPARAAFPIEVKVVAWQFGSGVEPKVKTAEPVERTTTLNK